MLKINFENLNKKIVIASIGIILTALSAFGFFSKTTETKAMWHYGSFRVGIRGDRQAKSEANSEWDNNGYIGVSAFIAGANNCTVMRGYSSSYGMGTQTAYSGWHHGTACSYWRW